MPRALRPVLVLLFALAGATGSHAWDDEPQTVLGFGYRSREMLRGVDLAGHGARAAVELKTGGARGRAEWFEPFRSGEPGSGALHGEYRWEFDTAGSIAAVAAHRRTRTTAAAFGRRHGTEVGLAFTRALPPGPQLTLDLRRDLRLRAQVTELRLAHDTALTGFGAFLHWSVFAGWVDAGDVWPDAPGPRRSDAHGYAGVEFRLPYRLGERTQVVAEAAFSGTRGASGLWSPRGREDGLRAAFGLSVTFDF